MNILGLSISRTKDTVVRQKQALQPLSGRSGGWWPWALIREPYTGAWQSNQEIRLDNVLTYFAVYACLRLISTDIGKLCLKFVEEVNEDVWLPRTSPAFSPVLRKPNRYQTISKFLEQWILSKLIHGNAYVLKERDNRHVVVAMYVLDPTRVTPLVAQDGSVYYELKRDDLSGLKAETVTIPASEIIHDTMITPFHPLIGVSPLYASALAAREGLSIQNNSADFFDNRSSPDGILTAPVGISDEQALTLQATWKARSAGNIAVLAGDLKYQPLSLTATDSQLIEQLKWTAENVCSTFGVPPYLVDIGPPPPYANFEPLLLKYHSQCIQSLTTNLENSLDEGLGLIEKIEGRQYGTYLDVDDLIWMDTATRAASANSAIGSGGMTPDEARLKYFGLGPVPGGDTPYMQQQYWPLKQLADRDIPQVPTTPQTNATPVDNTAETEKALLTFEKVKAIVTIQSHAHADELRKQAA